MSNEFISRINREPGWVLLSNGKIIDTKTLDPKEIVDVNGVGKVTAESCRNKRTHYAIINDKEVKDDNT